MDMQIGSKIKNLRLSQNLTLQELADKTELSVGYLSLVERGKTSLTIINLQKICNALNITMSELLLSTEQDILLVREKDRKLIYEEEGVCYEAMTSGNRSLTGICMIVSDYNTHVSNMHVSDEIGTIINGSMIVVFDNNEYELFEGDTLFIPAHTNHSFRKTSRKECVSYWTYNIRRRD
ncbi:hypothetical protein AN639_00055 [Candidatus Epulonipiscium fishelsonii]|uniref:Uncharacterized protein n=2 Tax=Candidatus Epulonipiscium fishelsonii TaxID=77094 RepID=A0ACC8XEQ5_9FIRM|nr:hypothetical protein AN396_05980 [Epulopiscium sp. SCG-B11WGA-EpuloA1]ONI41609.1 hypothetical protein AN396_03365 [Epulopiscium sp. SCG-B11WGA-EpuloA1]ONI43921.1 hypothetical protein AN639_00055 [Epulopiscium sp. SCG-B05WGA-EpuloA1]